SLCTATSPGGSKTVRVRATTLHGSCIDSAADDFTYTGTAVACASLDGAFEGGTGTDSEPNDIATADVNGDGYFDLIVANNASTSASLFLGAANGEFASASGVDVAHSQVVVVTGDIDSNGTTDLVFAGGGVVTVMPGNGDGTFGTAAHNPVPGVSDLAIGDFNGDGKSDLAICAGGVSIMLGTISGFAPATLVDGTASRAIAIGDFDSDGKTDLAVTRGTSPGNVAIL